MKEIFYLTTHSIHFIYGYMSSGCFTTLVSVFSVLFTCPDA